MLSAREAWFDGQLELDPETLIFVDETGASIKTARRYGRAPRGERLRMAVPHGHWMTTTFIGRLRLSGMTAPLVINGPVTGTWTRDLGQPGSRPDAQARRRRRSRQPARSQERRCAQGDRGKARPAALPSALLGRLQPDRERLRQAQGAPAQGRLTHRRRPLARDRRCH